MNLKIGYFGVLRRQEHEYGHKTLSIILKVYRPNSKKKSSPYLEICVSRFKDVKNTNMMKNSTGVHKCVSGSFYEILDLVSWPWNSMY